MTTFKKIDWLRQLYHEGTKWRHSFQGQVSWKLMEVQDPNNGSKFTVAELEAKLPELLNYCLENKRVPYEFRPEVRKCLAYIRKEETFDNKTFAKVVQARKHAISLFKVIQSLTDTKKDSVIAKFEMDDMHTLNEIMQTLVTRIQRHETTATSACGTSTEKSKHFKVIDWLRHIYLNCQKWLNNKQGQFQWKNSGVQDPNNGKEETRMSKNELMESLEVLAPTCLELNIVPRSYLRELEEAKRVLVNGLKFDAEILKTEENYRKMAVKLQDTLFGLKNMIEDVLRISEPSKLAIVFNGLVELLKHTGIQLQPSHDDVVHEEEEQEETLVVEQDLEEAQPDTLVKSSVDDGTSFLLEIMEQAASNEEEHTEEISAPCSPSSASEISQISFPPSPCRKSLDGHMSDDSGYYSPFSNPLDLEDPESLEEIEVDDDLFKDLDFSNLPDVTPYMSDGEDLLQEDLVEEIETRKRKLSEDFEMPVFKRARP